MELNLFMAGANQMVDDMGGGGIATSTAEPLVAGQTADDGARIMNAAVSVKWSQ